MADTLPAPDRRDAIVEQLSAAFAAGRLELEDLERRMELVYRARSPEELESALAGLPSADREPAVAVVPLGADHPKSSRRSIAIMSATVREGRWVPAARHRALVLMAGTKLDFRHAELEAGVTEVRLTVVMGGVEIIVPPDLDVEVDGFAIMGAIDRRDLHPKPLESQRSRLRIHARVVMGGVEVKVRERHGA